MKKFVLIFLFLSLAVRAQELPPVTNFSTNQYKAGNQNWMISQGPDDQIYIANSLGLLEFSGTHWNLYPVPNGTIVRAVQVVEDLIFTGAYMEAGFWQKNAYGDLVYTSLLPIFPQPVKDGEQFWHIKRLGETVVLQSFDGIYLYNLNSQKVRMLELASDNPVTNLYEVGNEIFFFVPDDGLYSIAEGAARLEVPASFLDNSEIVLVKNNEQGLEIITRAGNYYNWNGTATTLKTRLNKKLPELSIFSAVAPDEHSFLLGSVENGLFLVDKEGNILQHYNQERGLQNNTVLSLFLDKEKNIWSGLDNGLSVLNLNSPFMLFQDNAGKLGTVYTSFETDDYLYLGTNQGLYVRGSNEEDFKLIKGTNGQVWSLQQIDNYLFCGHNSGTFLIKREQAQKISTKMGTWLVKSFLPANDVYIQGHYNGFSFLKRDGDAFQEIPVEVDFPHSSKYIISKANSELWIGNEHKGVFKMRVSEALDSVSVLENYTFPNSIGITSSIFEYRDSLYYASKNGIFQYREKENHFSKNNELEKMLNDINLISGRFIVENDKIWGFGENSIFNLSPSPLSSRFKIERVYMPRELRSIPHGYENISHLNSNKYLLGLVDGYLTFDEDLKNFEVNSAVKIEEIVTSTLEDEPLKLDLAGGTTISYKRNSLNFKFAFPEYKRFVVPVFSYRLLGLSDRWSSWSTTPEAVFKNLAFGSYNFEVRAKVGDEVVSSASYAFEVARPWYFTNAVIAVYFLIFLALLYLIHRVYKKEHDKRIREKEKALRMKNLEAEQKIIKLENEQLEKEMAGKSRELAVSTMSLIKKNEFLTTIKEQFENAEVSTEVKNAIKKIEKETSEEDNWKFFKKAFSNADKDFFKKIKAKHPELTSHDLKLCAYLRLNLSSKEIAPLLNISTKSVEIKRYRLRKKMNLQRETNLVDYILAI